MMRHIVFDTETTGLSPARGDRLVEIAAIELLDMVATGEKFHVYVNPERDMPEEALRVHGLTSQFLADKPKFSEICDQFVAFIGEATLVAHNIPFDIGFINSELVRAGRSELTNPKIDTVAMARKRFPGKRANLDALCSHLGIDASHRTQHGAMIDTQLLAKVFIELSGGHQLALAPRAAPAETAPQPARPAFRIVPPVLPARNLGAASPMEIEENIRLFGKFSP
jgi:DNA polymerase-3 subunit epsilon